MASPRNTPPQPDYGNELDYGGGVKIKNTPVTKEQAEGPEDYVDYDDMPPFPEPEHRTD